MAFGDALVLQVQIRCLPVFQGERLPVTCIEIRTSYNIQEHRKLTAVVKIIIEVLLKQHEPQKLKKTTKYTVLF